MSDVKRYEAVHLRYDDNNIRYGEGCEVEVVLASDYAALEAELARLRAGQEPVLYVNGEHLALALDNPDKEGRSASASTVKGHYCDTPLYTTPQPSAVPDADIACDRSYRNGLIAGFGFGINGDEAGYQRSLSCYQQGIHEALAAAPSAPATVQGDAIKAQLLEALEFYARGDHLVLADDDAWDTCSGEPMNWLHDNAGTASVEDGSLARAAIDAARKEGKA